MVKKVTKGKNQKQHTQKSNAKVSKTRDNKTQGKTPRKGIKPAKGFIYALTFAAFGGGGYLIYDRIKRKKSMDASDDSSDTIVINNNLPSSYNAVPNNVTRASGSDSFPLKKGSSGSRVLLLQQALSKIIGTSVMNANGGIDGKFGKGTVSALKLAGYPERIDESVFNRITGSSGSNLEIVFNPSDIAIKLYRAAQSKNSNGVLSQLQQIKTVSDYSSVNEYYKKQSFISKTIVTDLLDFAFKGNEDVKEKIRNEFQRIGLKTDDSGRWSLQGIPLFKDLITLRETIVTDASNNRIPVRRNTILGDEVKVQSGMTWFRSIDHSILKVPTQDVKYT
ncbi:hypothetical protein BH10BAC4_BH10BAC4_18310 [soil metagenome]